MPFSYCFVSISPVRKENADPSEMVTQLLFGELVEVLEVQQNWTKITTYLDQYTGWVDTKHLIALTEKEHKRWLDQSIYSNHRTCELVTPWGKQYLPRGSFIGVEEEFSIGNTRYKNLHFNTDSLFDQPFELAADYLNTPYLWGGKTPYGIDCSGLTQQVFRAFSIQLPRDAYEQAEVGQTIEFEDLEPNDLAFFTNTNGKVIHVGIISDDKEIIHASGHVRKDIFTSEGIIHRENKNLTHHLSAIKRL